MFSAGKKINLNRFKFQTQILACSLDFRENNYSNGIDCFSLYQLPPY